MLPLDLRSWARQQEAFLGLLSLLPLGIGTGNLGTAGSHLWQLWDLNQPLEVLQVAGAVEKILEPERGKECLGMALVQPGQPLAWLQGESPSRCTALEGKVFCAATELREFSYCWRVYLINPTPDEQGEGPGT